MLLESMKRLKIGQVLQYWHALTVLTLRHNCLEREQNKCLVFGYNNKERKEGEQEIRASEVVLS